VSELSTIASLATAGGTLGFWQAALRDPAEDPWLWTCSTSRHWNLDRADPR
jgi:hypothetical protein